MPSKSTGFTALTVGVSHRIDALADRPAAGAAPLSATEEFRSLVPLTEILSEITGVGAGSKTVAGRYEHLLARLGSELAILETLPLEDIARVDSPVLAEAVSRLRTGRVIRDPGYDGEYGAIRLFGDGELARLGDAAQTPSTKIILPSEASVRNPMID